MNISFSRKETDESSIGNSSEENSRDDANDDNNIEQHNNNKILMNLKDNEHDDSGSEDEDYLHHDVSSCAADQNINQICLSPEPITRNSSSRIPRIFYLIITSTF